MKIKQVKNMIAGLFPAIFAPAFDRCRNARELEVVAEALRIAGKDAVEREQEFLRFESQAKANVKLIEHKLTILEEEFEKRRTQFDVIREPVIPQEEVILYDVKELVTTLGMQGFKNRIGLIKAVREVSNLGLKEAKDLVDDVLENGARRSVFRGPQEKAAVAARVLNAVGGVTERKESI